MSNNGTSGFLLRGGEPPLAISKKMPPQLAISKMLATKLVKTGMSFLILRGKLMDSKDAERRRMKKDVLFFQLRTWKHQVPRRTKSTPGDFSAWEVPRRCSSLEAKV